MDTKTPVTWNTRWFRIRVLLFAWSKEVEKMFRRFGKATKDALKKSWRETKIRYSAIWSVRLRRARALRATLQRASFWLMGKLWANKRIAALGVMGVTIISVGIYFLPKLWTWWKGVHIQVPTPHVSSSVQPNWIGLIGIVVVIFIITAFRKGWFKKLTLPKVGGFKSFIGSSMRFATGLVIVALIFSAVATTLTFFKVFSNYWKQESYMSEAQASIPRPGMMSEAEAAMLRTTMVALTEKDTFFVITATKVESKKYKRLLSFCFYTKPAHPVESYSFTTPQGTFLDTPSNGVIYPGEMEWLSVRAYGGDTTLVKVWHYPKNSDGKCKTPMGVSP